MVIDPGYLHIAEASLMRCAKKIVKDALLIIGGVVIGALIAPLVAVLLGGVGIALLVYDIMYTKSHKFVFYTDRVIVMKGIFTKHQDQVFLSKVLAVRYKQTFLGQIFNYGDVFIDQLGSNDFMCACIKSPQQLVDVMTPLVTAPSSPIF